VPVPETAPKGLSFPARVVGVLFSPTETFADIVRRPAFIAPLVLLMLLALGAQLLITQRIGVEQVVRSQIANNPRVAQLTPEQQEQAIQQGLAIAKYSMYATPLFSAVFFLAIAGLFLVIANFVLGGEVRYKTMFTVSLYGFMPGVVYTILAAITVRLKQPGDIDVRNLVPASNLGFLVDVEAHKALHRLAASMDVFSFWQLALLGIGIAAAARFSFKKGLAVVAIPWALWVLGALALSAIF